MITAIVQARMGSSRLPGKVLMRAAGQSMIEHLHERLSAAESIDGIVIATSCLAQDDPIAGLCQERGFTCFRGDEADVLDRYYRAGQAFNADPIVRVTADCPLIDPAIVDQAVALYRQHPGEYDLVTNRHPLTFPDGMDVNVMPFAALEQAWQSATAPFQREHVIPFFWETGKRVLNFEDPDRRFHRHRWTLDYPEDLRLISSVFEELLVPGACRLFTMQDILACVERHPEWTDWNAKYIPAPQ